MELSNIKPNSHTIFLSCDGKVIITDVIEILTFDETSVEFELTDRILTIEGNNFKIQSFLNERFEATVLGDVQSVYYSQKRSHGIDGGVFKGFMKKAFRNG